MTNRRRFVVTGVVLVVTPAAVGIAIALLAVGDGDGGDDNERGRWTIEDAREFKGFSLYWLGESFRGLPLTAIVRYRYGAEDSVAFIYGTCTPSSDGGCAPPVQIVLQPYCMRPPERLSERVKSGPPVTIRGVSAQPLDQYQIRTWIGDVTMDLFAEEPLEAAEHLRGVELGGPLPGEALPQPDGSSC